LILKSKNMDSETPPQYITVELAHIVADSHDFSKGKQRMRRRIAVAILFFVNGFGFASLPTRLPELQRFYNVSNTQLGLVLLCSSFGALAAMLLSSRVMARFGSQRVAAVTALSFASVLPFLTFIPYLSVLLPLFFLLGAAIGSLEVAMNAQAVEVERQFKRPLMSSFHAVFSIGGGIGAAVGTAMTWGNLSVFIHFLTVSVVSIGLLIWAISNLLPKNVMDEAAISTGENQIANPDRSEKAQRLAVLPIALLAFCSMASEGTLTNWTTIFCSNQFHTTATQSAFAFTAFTAAMTIGRLSGDTLTRQLGRYKLLIISILVALIGMSIVFFTINLPFIVLGFAGIGFGLSSIVPLTYSAAGNTEGVSASVGIPMISIFGYASFFIMPPLVGFLSDTFGFRILISILLGLGVTMLVLVLTRLRKI
jgi:fucose permease